MIKIFYSSEKTMSLFKTFAMFGVYILAILVISPTLNHVLALGDGCTGVNSPACSTVNVKDLGFAIPSLGDILTFFIRAFFAIAGISALFYLLLGAFAWITSGGDKDSITAAREKIQAAIIGLILIVAVLALIWTLEQVVFAKRICLGVSCPVTIPGLIKPNTGTPTNSVCCTCSNGTDIVNLSIGESCP